MIDVCVWTLSFLVDVCSYVVLEAMEHIVTVTRNTIIPHIHIETGRLLSGIVKFCGDECKN